MGVLLKKGSRINIAFDYLIILAYLNSFSKHNMIRFRAYASKFSPLASGVLLQNIPDFNSFGFAPLRLTPSFRSLGGVKIAEFFGEAPLGFACMGKALTLVCKIPLISMIYSAKGNCNQKNLGALAVLSDSCQSNLGKYHELCGDPRKTFQNLTAKTLITQALP